LIHDLAPALHLAETNGGLAEYENAEEPRAHSSVLAVWLASEKFSAKQGKRRAAQRAVVLPEFSL